MAIDGKELNTASLAAQGMSIDPIDESTMVLNMGERGQPRLKAPHGPLPVVAGVWGAPTLINNVETYSCVPHILSNGGAWYAEMGTERSKGTKVMRSAVRASGC